MDNRPVPTIPDLKPGKIERVTGKLRVAIDSMVWQGHHRDEAAERAGMVPKSLYNALRKHHVKAYYLEQLQVLRTSERARNIHTLAEVRDQTSNQMARVAAAKALEQIDDSEQGAGRSSALPGLQIVIVQGANTAPDPGLITINPHGLGND